MAAPPRRKSNGAGHKIARPNGKDYRLWAQVYTALGGDLRQVQSPVPEPATATLSCLGAAACLVMRRRGRGAAPCGPG
ncbi:PEP-CTERM sorting domain-containing protein [Aeoliella straminimaris]|uniref:PEP-CTERM sorting domain-containing protein n=1 Tax=Aeoliella straminimaris TaxID=2954799 RepID=UPI003CC6CAF9